MKEKITEQIHLLALQEVRPNSMSPITPFEQGAVKKYEAFAWRVYNALIEQEQKPMREVLQDAHDALITRMESDMLDKDYNGDFDFWSEVVEKVHKHPIIAKIDAVLGGSHE